jgi:competence protein ComEA
VKSVRRQIRNFFGFSRAQTNGFVLLVIILSVVLFSKPIYQAWMSNRPVDFSKERKALDSVRVQLELQRAESKPAPVDEKIAITFFEFNPNTVTAEELKALGFSARLKKGLLNYRAKGGVFRIKADVKKLYGMDSVFYRSLYPFIQLPEKITHNVTFEPKKNSRSFDLNQADTTQFQQVYGIGPVLARRIVKYRERLGGFVKKEQLDEIYGMDSVVIKEILKISTLTPDFLPRRININTADETLFSTHPYLSRKLARGIVTYRFQHGNYHAVDDLRRINLLDELTFGKIQPYLTVD